MNNFIKNFIFSFMFVPILVYHSFGPAKSVNESTMQKYYRVTASAFEAQMKYLADNKYHPIKFSTYVDSLKNNTKFPDKAIVLTFDDGWASQYKYAVPILEKYHFTGTFFIITGYANSKYKAYMSWDQIKELDKKGMDIESHSVHHFNPLKLSTPQLNKELVDSKKTLEEKLSHPITTYAYPDYIQNQAIRDAVKSAGYIGARAGWGLYKNSVDNIFRLHSLEVVNNLNPFSEKRLPD
jgi:peptidoglycan/xylan/chitin deacetylase (PgdA/CDA1 family)